MASTPNKACRLLFDVGGTFLKAVLADADGELIPESEFSSPMPSDGTRDEIINALTTSVARGVDFAAAHGWQLVGIGVDFPGPFDYAAGIPQMEHKFQSIKGCSVREILQACPGVGERMPIRFVHDVNAVLLGELFRGNAQRFDNVALVTLGTGLGFAFARGREVQCAPSGSPRLPIYNRPYRDGILEDWISKRGLLRIYSSLAGCENPTCTVAQMAEKAFAGDAASQQSFAEAGRILAEAISPLLAQEKIGCLLLGGQISRSFALLEPTLKAGLSSVETLQMIAPVAHIGEAAFYGLLSELGAAKSE